MTRKNQLGWGLALVGAGLAFTLGWLAGRQQPPPPVPAPAPSTTLQPEDVELRLDAGSLTLLPEGGLDLKPIEPLNGTGGSAGAGPIETP